MNEMTNGFERAIYLIHPPTKSVLRVGSCTFTDDPYYVVKPSKGWIGEYEDTGTHSKAWAPDGAIKLFCDQHGVAPDWKLVNRIEAFQLGLSIDYVQD
jgi:hypothetical protein